MIADHSQRYTIANELHARPFPSVRVPAFAAFIAIKPEQDAARRDRAVDTAHLIALLDRYGAPHPQPGATHYFGKIGKYEMKWESHTEFVTYTIFGDGPGGHPFDASVFNVFPEDWLAAAPGVRVTSTLIRVEPAGTDDEISRKLSDWFVPESLAVSNVLDGACVVAGDFRIDEAGHMRFAVFVREGTGDRRIGRIVQRLSEIETYKAMSMLGLLRSRRMSPVMGALEARLSALVEGMTSGAGQSATDLHELLTISAELEQLAAQSSFRFGATAAYEAIVHERIEAMREARFMGRQTFDEFMARRYDPAMRTVKAAERQLGSLSTRAMRAADLLRTRVDVERSAENQALLASMDRRADLQLRLQHTVEGLSVVAISYYAVSLASYLTYPVAEPLGLSKGTLTAGLVLPVVLLVWLMVRRIRKSMSH